MKKIKFYIPGFFLVVITVMLFSCSKDTPHVADVGQLPANSANIQVYNATVKATRNYVYVDNSPVSGVTFSYGGVFPSTAYSFSVTAGSHSVSIKDTLKTSTQIPLIFSQNFDAGKSYTIFTYDTTTAVKQLTVQNNIFIPGDTTARLRFANFIYNAGTTVSVDVYSFKRIPGTPVLKSTPVLNNANLTVPVFTGSTPVFSNVGGNMITEFIPYPSSQGDTLYVFAAGTTSPLISKGTINSLTRSRSYTSVAAGSYRGNLASRSVNTFATY